MLRPSFRRRASLVAALVVALATAPRALQFGPPQTVGSTSGYEAVAADVDQDGDEDLLVAAVSGLSWYENTDGLGAFGPARPVTASSLAYSVFAEDLDGDGDLDVAAGWSVPARVAWYENTDGAGTFGPENVVTAEITGFPRVRAADLDGDGDQDVLVTSPGAGVILWYPNADGLGTFGPRIVIDSAGGLPWDAVPGDLDGDGDLDVLAAKTGANEVVWYENTDGLGTFGPGQPITFCNQARAVWAADMDGDGDLDALYGCSLVQLVRWHENVDGQGTFATGTIVSLGASGVNDVRAVDLDGDGNQDTLFTAPLLDVVGAYVSDGQGGYSALAFLPVTAPLLDSVAAGDLNGDGVPDAISAGSSVLWFANLTPQAALELVVPGVPPNPVALLPGVTSGPVPGAIWDPVVDHTSFFPGAALDFLGLSLTSVNVPLPPFGTLLCGPVFLALFSAPGVPFAIAIPPDPTLLGASLCAAAGSVDLAGTVLLTNALEVKIGSF